MRDAHRRRDNRRCQREHHDTSRETKRAFPGIDTSSWTVKEIREYARSKAKRQDDGRGEDNNRNGIA